MRDGQTVIAPPGAIPKKAMLFLLAERREKHLTFALPEDYNTRGGSFGTLIV